MSKHGYMRYWVKASMALGTLHKMSGILGPHKDPIDHCVFSPRMTLKLHHANPSIICPQKYRGLITFPPVNRQACPLFSHPSEPLTDIP